MKVQMLNYLETNFRYLMLMITYFLFSASVTAVFALDNDKEMSFQRSVQGSSSEYRINGNVSNLPYNIKIRNIFYYISHKHL